MAGGSCTVADASLVLKMPPLEMIWLGCLDLTCCLLLGLSI
jgi:hypothetical protein